jgi:SIR2-like protein
MTSMQDSGGHLDARAPDEARDQHYRTVVRALQRGRVVPLLGAGANLCDRGTDETASAQPWAPGRELPSGSELSQWLSREYDYPSPDASNLSRVSQYIDAIDGDGPLYDSLREAFIGEGEPSSLHCLLADLPTLLDVRGTGGRYQLIITTNYDDAIERAFQQHDPPEPYDLVVYLAGRRERGHFIHLPPSGEPRVIERPNEYKDLSLRTRTVILKVHGAVDREDPERDSFVITEDDYIDFLSRTNLSALVPAPLLAAMFSSHFLFLGYSLHDWNLRVILHRIWSEQSHDWADWSIQHPVNPVEKRLWAKRSVDVEDIPLHDYVAELRRRLTAG